MLALMKRWVREYEEASLYFDKRVKDLPLLNNTILYVLGISAVYLLMVFIGPRIMRNRRPYNPWGFMVLYNFAMASSSLVISVSTIYHTISLRYSWICEPCTEEKKQRPEEYRLAMLCYVFYLSKIVELTDTFLMIVRKKNDQITLLHVFHHVTMCNIYWWVVMFIAAGSTWFGLALNSLVHFVMYSYYGLALIPSMRLKLWWKKYLTRFQMFQFVAILVHSLLGYTCDFPPWGPTLQSSYMVVMLVLFGNFYFRAYKLRRREHYGAKAQQRGDEKSESSRPESRKAAEVDSLANGSVAVANGNARAPVPDQRGMQTDDLGSGEVMDGTGDAKKNI